MKEETKMMKCMACLGKGYVPRPKRSRITEEQKKEALKLYRQGIGYREICRRTGILHPQSVKNLIIKANN